ncbi:MAG: SPFH domain-containing protein [Candidatus Thorarchaeota archaeon]
MATQETASSNGSILVAMIVAMTIIMIVFLLFYLNRYRKFTAKQFVIHFRNGKVKSVGIGGRLFLLPVFDEYATLPAAVQCEEFTVAKTDFRSSTARVRAPLTLTVLWRVATPLVAYQRLEFQEDRPNYAGTIIQDVVKRTVIKEVLKLSENRDEWLEELQESCKGPLSDTFDEWGLGLVDFSVKASARSH